MFKNTHWVVQSNASVWEWDVPVNSTFKIK